MVLCWTWTILPLLAWFQFIFSRLKHSICVSLLLCEVTKWTIIVISQWNLLIFKSELQLLLTRFPSCGVRMLLFGRQVLTKIRQISTIGYSLTRGKCWGVIHTHTHWYDISLALLWKENSSEKKLQDLNYAVNFKKKGLYLHIVQIINQTVWECLIGAVSQIAVGLIYLEKSCGFSAMWKQSVF